MLISKLIRDLDALVPFALDTNVLLVPVFLVAAAVQELIFDLLLPILIDKKRKFCRSKIVKSMITNEY